MSSNIFKKPDAFMFKAEDGEGGSSEVLLPFIKLHDITFQNTVIRYRINAE
jgi:hypothetical protein